MRTRFAALVGMLLLALMTVGCSSAGTQPATPSATGTAPSASPPPTAPPTPTPPPTASPSTSAPSAGLGAQLLVADPAAKAIYVYSSPDFKLLATIEGVSLSEHAG